MIDRFKKFHIIQFFEQLNRNKGITSIYNTLGLINELQRLEEEFQERSKRLDFVVFYRSLLNRICDYAQNPQRAEQYDQYKKVLHFLYTAALCRIHNLKDKPETNLMIDITRFLYLVKSNIQTLQDLRNANNKANIIKKHNDVFRSQVDGKIEEAKCFIEKQIVPEIDNINQEIDHKIDLLLKETLKLKNKLSKRKKRID
ncbi:hypothetical protein CDAR_303391 [Caerostris darwini]|uniref:Uncharacterized protein n=1 Tax=Caerostris darwini TaxID=1538125 RepID=A0AAV4MZ74_9ARAC|nr:hypothetical protein CDAR_303391 [Caerostris darwini]